MKLKKLLTTFLCAVLCAAVLSACGDSDSAATTESTSASVSTETSTQETAASESESGTLVITDMSGREVEITLPVTKVVALTAADCEIIYALGAEDTLVGRGEYCDYPEEVNEVTSVQSGGDTNIEEIIALEPEVLIMSTMAQTEEQVQQLEDAGVSVVVSDAQDIEGVYEAITLIGTIVDKEDEAAALVAEMQDGFAELSASAEENTGKTVYFEVSPLEYGLWAAGTGTFMDEIANMLGLTNIFSDV